MEAMICGYAEIVANNRSLAAVLVFDSSVRHVLQTHDEWGEMIGRQLALLMQPEPAEHHAQSCCWLPGNSVFEIASNTLVSVEPPNCSGATATSACSQHRLSW
jgi:hypothetical protein